MGTQDWDGETTVSREGESSTEKRLKWIWKVTRFEKMMYAGGISNLTWCWKVGVFALPNPFNKKRYLVSAGPVSSFWLFMLLVALALRIYGQPRASLVPVGIATIWIGLISAIVRSMAGCGKLRRTFILHLLGGSALIWAGLGRL